MFEDMTQVELDAVPVRRLSVHITDKCNLNCNFCGFESGPTRTTEMTVNTFKRLTMFAEMLKIPLVEISGGEPFLHTRFWDILDVLGDIRFIGLITNATLIDPAKAARIRMYNFNAVKVSFDHDELNDRSVQGATNMVNKGVRVKAMVTVSEQMGPADVITTIRKAYENGIWKVALRAIEPNGRAAWSNLPRREILEDIAVKVLDKFNDDFVEFSCGFEFVNAICNYPSSQGDESNITVLTNGDLFHDHCKYTASIRNGESPDILGNILTNSPEECFISCKG